MANLSFVDVWAPLINFIIFCILASIFLKKTFKNMAKNRNEKFIKEKEAAERVKLEAEEKLADLNKEYNSLQATVDEIKKNAEADAKREASKIVDEAKLVAANLESEIQKIAATELALANTELRNKILAEVKLAVSDRVKKDFTPEMAKSFMSKQASRLDALN